MLNKIGSLKAALLCEVEYKSLGALEDLGLVTLGRGKIISKKEMNDNPGDYPVYSSSASGDGEIGRYGEYMFEDERITWSIDGGGKFFYRNGIKYSVTNVGGHIKVNSDLLSTKYLFYVLSHQWETKQFDYVKKAHPSVIRDEYSIPIIPIEIQKTIVDILDCISLLSQTLTEELTVRKKQMAHYADSLLNKSKTRFRLDEVCQIIDCPHTSPKWQTSGVPVIRNYNLVNGAISMNNLSYVTEEEYQTRIKRVTPQKDDILFSREAPIGNVGIIPEGFRCCQGQRVVLLRAIESVIRPKFLLHLLQGDLVKDQIAKIEKIGSTVSNFNISDLKKLEVCVPSLNEQDRIISQLDAFSKLCSDFSEGLPAEIEARNRQFVYYRNKLLSFPKRKVV